MYIKTCEVCYKEFKTLTRYKRTCSETCMLALKKESRENTLAAKGENEQICITCQRATGKCIGGVVCPWARSLKPVKEWVANEIVIKEEPFAPYKSYDIIKCPLYLQDELPLSLDEDLNCRWNEIKTLVASY